MGGKSSTISTSEQRILSMQIQQSSYGLALPIVFGQNRIAGNLIDYTDFTAVATTTRTTQGGKGGGGVTQEDTKYTYEAAVIMGLCHGPIAGIPSWWRDKERRYGLRQDAPVPAQVVEVVEHPDDDQQQRSTAKCQQRVTVGLHGEERHDATHKDRQPAGDRRGMRMILAPHRVIQQIQSLRHRLQQPQRQRGDGQRQQRCGWIETTNHANSSSPATTGIGDFKRSRR